MPSLSWAQRGSTLFYPNLKKNKEQPPPSQKIDLSEVGLKPVHHSSLLTSSPGNPGKPRNSLF